CHVLYPVLLIENANKLGNPSAGEAAVSLTLLSLFETYSSMLGIFLSVSLMAVSLASRTSIVTFSISAAGKNSKGVTKANNKKLVAMINPPILTIIGRFNTFLKIVSE